MMSANNVISEAVTNLLKPLVTLLLKNGIACDAVCSMLKSIYVEVAQQEEFTLPGKKQTISRISTLTGLTRKEVSVSMNAPENNLSSMSQEYNRAARVITGWVRDKDFHTKQGKPKDLNLEEGNKSFKELVRRYSGDIPHRAISDELIRVGALEKTKSGKLHLKSQAYIPEKDMDRKLNILGTDVADLIKTISYNIYDASKNPLYQRKVSYNAIPVESMNKIRSQLNKKAQSCLEDMDRLLVKYDSDMDENKLIKGECRAGVGIYYFEEVSQNEVK